MNPTPAGMVTPLQPKDFFQGVWHGEGELVPHPLVRSLVPRERFRFFSEAVWLSETVWLVKDRSEFASGSILERKMFAELKAADRIGPLGRMQKNMPNAGLSQAVKGQP
jgi:hypothetical protein